MPSRSSEATSRRRNFPGATNSLSDLVVPAIDEEKSTLLGTQNTRPTTIEMTEKPVAEDDGVLRRERPSTLRADPRLLFHPDSRRQAGCQRARCRQTPRNRWQTHARPVEEGTGCYGKTTLPRTQRSILVPKRDSGEALGRLPGSLAEWHDAHQRPGLDEHRGAAQARATRSPGPLAPALTAGSRGRVPSRF